MTACEYDKLMFEPRQWWNGDVHLCRVIGTMALTHRDMGNCYPAELELQEWRDILTRIGEPLLDYAQHFEDIGGITPERRLAARDAMRLFAEWFEHLSD